MWLKSTSMFIPLTKKHQIEHNEVLVSRKKPQMENLIDLGQQSQIRNENRRRNLNRVILFNPPSVLKTALT
jgi:hypothetical protein